VFGEPNSWFEIVFKILVLGVLPTFFLVRLVYLDVKNSRSQKESSKMTRLIENVGRIRGVLGKTLLISKRNLQENKEYSNLVYGVQKLGGGIPMARPKTTKPYRQRKVRFSYLEDAFRRVLDKVEDPKSRMEIQKELATLIGKEKALEKEKEMVG
jgi:hypothetical protein